MAQLQRIILIHTHLPGVVELSLDGHTNICGTNASGKTTLQRLVPVFYGEQPNRVVPKTRKKFDEFYLPYNNSYLVYEYVNAQGQASQVVLTPKAEGGVDYRFVGAGYAPEQLLQTTKQGAQGLTQSEWLAKLKELSIDTSHKISATSEFRAIIQHDLSAMRGSHRDNLRLRHLAARYGLVKSPFKLRHIEKLVSAVHAKEGKMDTLRTMLAAILEEEGHQRPSSPIKASRIRQWTQQMRVYMGLDDLAGHFQQLENLGSELAGTHALLWQLQPALTAQQAGLTTEQADLQTVLSEIQRTLDEEEEAYQTELAQLSERLGHAEARLRATERDLEDNDQQYQTWLERDMDSLARDTESLPLLREELQETIENYQLLVDAHASQQQELDGQKLKLRESLERVTRKHQQTMREIQQEYRATQQQQDGEEEQLKESFESAVKTLREEYEQQLESLTYALAEAKATLSAAAPTHAELDEKQKVEARVEDAQLVLDQQAQLLRDLQRDEAALIHAQQAADHALTLARQGLHQAEQNLAVVQQRLTPDEGTLRHYLREHREGWEQSLGKVLAESLLERTDLHPHDLPEQASVLGLGLDLSGVAVPAYAAEEKDLAQELAAAKAAVKAAKANKTTCEAQLSAAHQAVKQHQQKLSQAKQSVRVAEQERDFARDARTRLALELDEQLSVRRKALQQSQAKLTSQREQLLTTRDEALASLRYDFDEQRMELKAGWQEALTRIEERGADLEQQLEEKRARTDEQIKTLEKSFRDALGKDGVNPKDLERLKSRRDELTQRIRQIESQQDDLRRYQDFMRVDYGKKRPEWLALERELKQTARDTERARDQLKVSWQERRQSLQQQKKDASHRGREIQDLLQALTPLLRQLSDLPVAEVVPDAKALQGDVREQVERCQQALLQREKQERQLRERLEQFDSALRRDGSSDFLDTMERVQAKTNDQQDLAGRLHTFGELLSILQGQQQQMVEQGRNIGGSLDKFFTVFNDINTRVGEFSRRLSDVVADDLVLEGIDRSEVKIISTIDELSFWEPLRKLSKLYQNWTSSGDTLPPMEYMDRLQEVAELLKADQEYSLESLLRLELYLSEGGSDLIIRSDRQLMESSSHGMAYLILCKFLLAFTRLLRGEADVTIHWPIDEIGTLAYHNVEKLFRACEANQIQIVGAFPNPESEVLLLFQHRYLIEASASEPSLRQLKRVEPRSSALGEKLRARRSKAGQEVSA